MTMATSVSTGAKACATTTTSSSSILTNKADALPQETALHLLDFLDAVSLSQCAQTYSTWRKLASTDLLWHRLCKSEFGIDGGKTDYTSRWQQERKRAFANLTLYLDFLDEIYFSLAGFFSLVSLFVVFPTLLVLKIDGWLDISWTQVFGCIYGLAFIAVIFVLVRITLLATVFSPISSLKNCATYCSVAQVVKRIIANQDVARKVAGLMLVPCAAAVIPFSFHLYADGYLATPGASALLVWMSVGLAASQMKHATKTKRNNQIDMAVKCAFATSSLLLAKAMIVEALPWCVIACPLAALPTLAMAPLAFQHKIFKHVYGRIEPSHPTQRRQSSTDGTTGAAHFYQNYPPLVSLVMIALKMDGVLTCLPWSLVMVDYVAWVIHGSLALYARQLIQVMFREMPIPANLRKL